MPHLLKIIAIIIPSVLGLSLSAADAGQSAPSPRAEAQQTNGVARLKGEIDAILLREFLPVTNASIKVVSLKDGNALYEFNPRLLLHPASTHKLVTAAAALSVLGPDREVVTTVAVDAGAAKIYLKGCGDGLLSERDLADLATAAAAKIGRDREFGVVADVSCFDDLYRGKGWMWDDDEFLISPLSVDQNAVTVRVRPGSREGASAIISTEPKTSYYTLANLVKTGAASGPNSIKAFRRPDERDNVITVSGVIPLGSATVVKHASVWRPELMALTLFRDALVARGVTVTGMSTAPTPAGATVVARKSRRVEELVRFALKTSDNVTAESLLKLMGLEAGSQPGSAEAGSAAVRGYLERQGIPTDGIILADGSGLSRYNLSSAEGMTALLQAVHRNRDVYRIILESLPVAGKDGTLKERMKVTSAEGNVRAKTGNMTGVSSLAGYAATADGEPLAFSITIQNFAGSGRHAREVQDRIAALLCGLRRTR